MSTTPRWFIKQISQVAIPGGFIITIITDLPCHLYLLWTDKIPWTHVKARLERGIIVPWDAYWCYVLWTIIDQNEPGDTLVHTYNWLGWQVCQTKYFRFHGTIGSQTSPSDSPIYSKHYSGVIPPIILKEHFDMGTIPDINAIYGDSWSGYAFIAESSYALNHIVNYYTVRELPADLIITLQAADADWKPTGPILASTSIDKSGLFAWPNYSQKQADLAYSPIVLGQKYAIVMHIVEATPPYAWHLWWSHGPNLYRTLISSNGGTTWAVSDTARNVNFENWGS